MEKTRLVINLNTLKENVKNIINKYNDYKYYFGVVKSGAYGHGEEIVNSLIDGGVNYLAVSYVEEALRVRTYNKDIPILILEPIDLDDLNICIENNFTITVSNKDYLKKLIDIVDREILVHIKIDSGMNRLGFKDKNEVLNAFYDIKDNKYLTLEGIYTHFATVGLYSKTFDNQLETFKELTSLLDLKKITIVHLMSSVNIVSHPKLEFCNGIRMGIMMYGYNPTIRVPKNGIKNKLRIVRNKYYQKKYDISGIYTDVELDIKPAISFYTRIIEIKKVRKGEYIGYGASYEAKENMLIAILPIGYNNGIGANVKNRYVFINGNRCDVVGQMAMNMMAVRVDDSISVDDRVEVLGENVPLKMLASFEGRTAIETLLMLGNSNEKEYISK